MNSHRRVCILFCIAFICHGAVAQQESGTVIILSLTRDKAIVAADSRESNGNDVVVTDQGCKILAFDDKAIFTLSGTRFCEMKDSERGNWNAQGAAISVYKVLASQTMRVMGSDFIHAWDKEMLRHMNFQLCTGSHLGPHGEVLTALFFDLDSFNRIEGYADMVSLHGSRVETNIVPLTPNGLPMGSGWTDVLDEFLAAVTPRAKAWHKRIDNYSPERRVQALGQLTREFDTSGHVGGNIDMAVLTAKGIQWISTKTKCQQQH
ncbi:MAG TPA: hypothetical protein VN948_05725 [Terriglobales bacterium]|nr:hypothetical protein [Terriglobales bacterium]